VRQGALVRWLSAGGPCPGTDDGYSLAWCPFVDSLLCVANFPASTGYAWTFIGRMFAEVANALSRDGIRTVVAYPLLDARPESLSGSAAEAVGADLSLDSPRSIRAAVDLVRREHVRAVWLVDRPVVSPAYALLHGAGVRRVVVHDHSSGTRQVRHGVRGLAKRLATRLPWAAADAVIDELNRQLAERIAPLGNVFVIDQRGPATVVGIRIPDTTALLYSHIDPQVRIALLGSRISHHAHTTTRPDGRRASRRRNERPGAGAIASAGHPSGHAVATAAGHAGRSG